MSHEIHIAFAPDSIGTKKVSKYNKVHRFQAPGWSSKCSVRYLSSSYDLGVTGVSTLLEELGIKNAQIKAASNDSFHVDDASVHLRIEYNSNRTKINWGYADALPNKQISVAGLSRIVSQMKLHG